MRLLYIVNVDWFFLSHRLPIALEAISQNYEVHIATTSTGMTSKIKSFGIQVHELSLDRSGNNFFSFIKSFFQIFNIVKKNKPDILHLVTIKPVILGGIAARILNIPGTVIAISGLGTIFIASGLLASVRRFFVKKLYSIAFENNQMKVIFQNDNDKELIKKIANLEDWQIELIPGSGVDLSKYQVQEIPNERPIIMLAARLLRDKGIYEFVGAAKLINDNEKYKQLAPRFVIVGQIDTDNPASLTAEEIRKIEAENNVEFWDYQSQMHKIIPQAHIVVLPSYREGLPKVLIEAAACGRAVITTDVPGCRDAIINEVTGLLVPVKDTKKLSLAIERLLNNKHLLMSLGENGRKLAEEKFDVKQVVAEHMRIYDSFYQK